MDFTFTEEQETISQLTRDLFERRPADRAARSAKSWAAEAGARVAATAQHVHGGIGIDTTDPLRRYFLWAKHNELALGPAAAQLSHPGATYSEGLS